MRTAALYSSLLLLIAGALIFSLHWGRHELATQYVESYRAQQAASSGPKPHPQSSPTQANGPEKHIADDLPWHFEYSRDARNYGLSEEQCNAAFPQLYKEIDRAVQYRWEKVGNITQEETNVEWRGDGIVKAQIHNNQLYVIDPHEVWDHNHRPRTLATLSSIHRAITSYQGKLPDIEFSFTVQDFALHDEHGNQTVWSYTRKLEQETLWLMPDFGLWGWPDVGLRSYAELQEVLEHEEDEFVDKIPKLVWRGSLAVGSKDVRNGLVKHSAGRSWSDVLSLDWSNKTNIQQRLLTMQDHCAYMYVAQTEGNTYSGRLKFLLNCHSILFSHDLKWLELFHHLLQPSGPEQNYVRVKRDFGDLDSKITSLIRQPVQSQRIADNARRTFRERYLTPAAEACYWRALIRSWASVQGFQPEFWMKVTEYDKVSQATKQKRKPRGVPFESYAIMEQVDWEIPAKPRKICLYEVE